MKTSLLWNFIFPYLKKYKTYYFMLCIFVIVGIFYQTGAAWFFQNMTNNIFSSQQNNLLFFLFIGIILIVVIMITNFFNVYFISKTTNLVKRDIRIDLFKHLLQQPMSYISSTHSGSLQSQIHQDTEQLDGVLGHNIAQLIILPFSGAVALVYLSFINIPLALITLSLGPLILIASKFFGVAIRNNGEIIQENTAKMSKQLQESFEGHTLLKTFRLEKQLTYKYKQVNEELISSQIKEGKFSGFLQAVASGVGYGAQILIFAIGTFFVANNQITIGDLLAFIILSQSLITPFSNIGQIWTNLQRSLSAVSRIYNFLLLPKSKMLNLSNVEQQPVKVTFDQVSFGYSPNKNIIHNINLTIMPNQSIAIIGESGAGKSTLMKLLLGLYSPVKGNIYLELNGKAQEELKGINPYTSYVPQDAFLFDDTIYENVRYGKLDATDNQINNAAKQVSATSFINQLDGDYQFQVGERGNRLSGGQRQRITLARAFIGNRSIVVFDEATSALDIQTEETILKQLLQEDQEQTILMITHRLSTAMYCDKIVLMANGCIIAEGKHEELLAASDYYKDLYQKYIDANTK